WEAFEAWVNRPAEAIPPLAEWLLLGAPADAPIISFPRLDIFLVAHLRAVCFPISRMLHLRFCTYLHRKSLSCEFMPSAHLWDYNCGPQARRETHRGTRGTANAFIRSRGGGMGSESESRRFLAQRYSVSPCGRPREAQYQRPLRHSRLPGSQNV